jgi:hypothetical protein
MNYRRKIMLCAALFTASLNASNQALINPEQIDQTMIDTAQDPIALNIIKAMQKCIEFNNITQLNLDANGIAQQHSAWQDAIKLYHTYINDLRSKHNSTRSALPTLATSENADSLMMQINQSKLLFTRLLDEYIAHLGQVYEKKSGLLGFYSPSYYIASRNDQSLSITPNEYTLLVQTLNNAAKQFDWGNFINLNLLVAQENGSTSSKSLTLNQIISAIKQLPLPAQYSTAAKIGMGVVAAAAVGAGAYAAYQTTNGQLLNVAGLEKELKEVENKLDVTPSPTMNDLDKKMHFLGMTLE